MLGTTRRRRAASPPATRPVADTTPEFARDAITVVGARQHNLKNVTVSFPRDRLTVCTGVSGSGKTSFAIDTVFIEGYRRYVESLSAYARQFLGQMGKPRVEHVAGLSPAICIEQKAASKSPRSTVGTITEIYDYMRVLWARVGTPHCVRCHVPIGSQTVDEMVGRIMALDAGTPIILLAPVSLGDGETYATLFTRLKNSGYTRVRVDGEIQLTAGATTLDARRRHRVEVVIDRTVVRARSRGRITEGVEHALALAGGVMTLLVEAFETVEEEPPPEDSAAADVEAAPPAAPRVRHSPAREFMFSQKLACPQCGTSYEELSPHHYSFNSQLGWCETCEGLGVQRGAPVAAIIAHPTHSLFDGAIAGWGPIDRQSPFGRTLLALCHHLGVKPSTPLRSWTAAQKRVLLYGTAATGRGGWLDGKDVFAGVRFQWCGFVPAIDAATRNSWLFRHRLHNVVTDIPCVACHGGRLRPDASAVRLGGPASPDDSRTNGTGRTIVEVCEMPLRDAAEFFRTLKFDTRQRQIAGEVLKEIRDRLQFLLDVGLEYLNLHRAAPTLSGGEAQRIRLASQIGSGLSGVLYVLDEPTIGLHQRDNLRLINALRKLRDLGNTLLVVEHDREVIAHADRLLDFGPGAGTTGGQIVAQGAAGDFLTPAGDGGAKQQQPPSLTRAYLSGATAVAVPTNRRPVAFETLESQRPQRKRKKGEKEPGSDPGWLVVRGARQNNLRNIDVPIPLGRFTCVTGVSGSGKSSLVNDILWPALAIELQRAALTPGEHDALEGAGDLDKVINVDQSPIGSTPSSNPATYTGAFDGIRELFARLPDSKMRGYGPNRFSFNRPGGRCEACEGYGQKCIEMHFMPDVWVECETCHGHRYNPETLAVKFKDKSIADVLDLRVGEALDLFGNIPRVRRMLQTLADVGLDYVQLGQPAPTLSGGEAQRVKLAAELGKPDTGRTFYILDEPTTGLHFDDVRKLLAVIHRLVDLGNTVLVVEHNLDVIKSADWVIDLGPEAGEEGGALVALGTPEELLEGAAQRRAAQLSSAEQPKLTSHTAAALEPVLASSPREHRQPYDAAAHAARELEAAQGGFGEVGRDVRMPWQVDGRKWHLSQRESRGGQERRWEPAALEYVIELVQKAGPFAPANWNERASVEVTAPDAPKWFLHALTGGEWLLELYFRVPPGTFKWPAIDEELGLKTLDEREDLPTYGDWSRVDVRKRRDGLDAVAVYVHDKKEINTPAFRRFVKKAAKAYLKAVAGMP
ncbi:MAG: excinuclease ABC subunit UvrA [Phycisphaerae bacterium]